MADRVGWAIRDGTLKMAWWLYKDRKRDPEWLTWTVSLVMPPSHSNAAGRLSWALTYLDFLASRTIRCSMFILYKLVMFYYTREDSLSLLFQSYRHLTSSCTLPYQTGTERKGLKTPVPLLRRAQILLMRVPPS